MTALKFPSENVLRRVLANIPAYRPAEQAAEVERLETFGHSDEEVAALRAAPTNPDDPREGTEADPRIIGRDSQGKPMQPRTYVSSVTASDILKKLLGDEFFVSDLMQRNQWTGQDSVPTLSLVAQELNVLAARGLASCTDGNWTMTDLGLEALTAEQEVASAS